jgi:GNAT superfamily N-acetyltransferase
MTIDIVSPKSEHVPALRQLWQDTFGDGDEFLDAFFSVGFRPERCLCALSGPWPVAAMYWFDCTLRGEKVAYLYALATKEIHRGQGIATRLMERVHAHLKAAGYSAALLVPASKGLGRWYQQFGYEYSGKTAEFSCQAPGKPVALRPVPAAEYASLRKQYLPQGSVQQAEETLKFLATHSQMYAGDGVLLTVQQTESGRWIVPEFLGDLSAVPGVLGALKIPGAVFHGPVPTLAANGAFRPGWLKVDHTPVMFRPLAEPAPAAPVYFAFPMS